MVPSFSSPAKNELVFCLLKQTSLHTCEFMTSFETLQHALDRDSLLPENNED